MLPLFLEFKRFVLGAVNGYKIIQTNTFFPSLFDVGFHQLEDSDINTTSALMHANPDTIL